MLFETFKLKVSVGTTSPKCIPIQALEAAIFSLILNFFTFRYNYPQNSGVPNSNTYDTYQNPNDRRTYSNSNLNIK